MSLKQVMQARAGTRKIRLLHCGFNAMLDFCLWTLEVDGLQVAPFIGHRDHTHLLRAAGLNSTTWWQWFARAAALQAGGSAAPRSAWQLRPVSDPVHLWLGEPAVLEPLRILRQRYEAVVDRRRACEQALQLAAPYHGIETLLRRGTDLPETLYVHLAAYPSLIACTVAPAAIVVGLPRTGICREAFHIVLRRGIARLAGSAPRVQGSAGMRTAVG